MLKRNRTLKVLNLSDNKIDPLGLMALAEALVSDTAQAKVKTNCRNIILC